jgi:hypothetical protein
MLNALKLFFQRVSRCVFEINVFFFLKIMINQALMRVPKRAAKILRTRAGERLPRRGAPPTTGLCAGAGRRLLLASQAPP